MTFAEHIDEIVRESKAYDNPFFAHCKDSSKYAPINGVVGMAISWYLVTKHFGLSAQEYDGLLARRLKYFFSTGLERTAVSVTGGVV